TTTRLVQEAGARLKALGYRPQLGQRPDGVNLFLLEGGRRALRRVGDQIGLVGSRERLETVVLTERLGREPAVFSPNVVLRPVTQDTLFPTIAYIAGPNEIAYFAQLKEVYTHCGVPMPVILPRASLTIVEGRIERLLRILDLALTDLGSDPEVTLARVVRRRLPRAFERRLGRALATSRGTFQDLSKLVATFDPTLVPRVTAAEEGLTRHLKDLERRLIRSYKRRNQELATQVRRLHAHLLPQGDLQERGLGFAPYLLRYGPRLVEVLRGAIDGPGWTHRVVSLGERQKK
ncbi:MAG: bacillithiol biosynthesis BshC, partial [Candidatus Methylomirabilales bacterium]